MRQLVLLYLVQRLLFFTPVFMDYAQYTTPAWLAYVSLQGDDSDRAKARKEVLTGAKHCPLTLQYLGEETRFEMIVTTYFNDRLAVVLCFTRDFDEVSRSDYEESALVLSVNVPESPLRDDEFFVKTYSENEGVMEQLIEHGIIEFTGRYEASARQFPICRLCRRYE